MFTTIFTAELRHWLRQPIPYLFALVLLAVSFIVMWGMASEAAGGDNVEVLNSPFRLNFMTSYLSMLMLFLLPSVVGAALHRDYKSQMYTVLYAFPIEKRDYLLAKFSSAMLIVFIVVAMIGLGFATGALMPGIAPEVIAPFSPVAYAQLYGLFILPNMVLFGLLVFLVVIKTRNIYLAFIAVIVLVAAQAIVGGLLQSADLQTVAALLDPTGDTAVKKVMRGFTLAERNELLLPFTGVILANRLLWFWLTFLLALYTYRAFSFGQFASGKKGRITPQTTTLPNASGLTAAPLLRPVVASFYPPTSAKAIYALATHHFRSIVFSYPFLALLIVGFLTVYLQQAQMNPEFGFETLPTTARMLRIPMLIFSLTVNLITFLYVGVLAHRGRMTRMGDLVDVSPTPDWALLLSRLLAIFRVQLLLLLLVIIAGVLTQLSKGYTRLELWHYALDLFGLSFVHFAIWACMATFAHTFFKNLYVGFFVLIITGSAFSALAEIGKFMDWPLLADGVVQFNTTPRVFGGFLYSDWNGYGDVLGHYLAYKAYWLLFGGLLLLAALAFWQRGYTFTWRERRMQAWGKLARPLRTPVLGLGIAFISLGAGLYYHDHVLADFSISDTQYEEALARNERLYGAYLGIPQPRIVRADIDLDIFPEERRFTATGTLWFVNKLARPLDTIIVNTSLKDRVEYTLPNPHETISQDEHIQVGVYRLHTPLVMGDSLAINFQIRNATNAPLWANDRVKTNGTYLLGYHLLPRLGVRATFLTDANKRAEYDLPEQAPSLEKTFGDSARLGYENAANSMDRIQYTTTVSTSADQRALSMGTLTETWQEGDRRYFRYVAPRLMQNDISWLSGEYVTTTDLEGIIPLEFHNHPDHLAGLEHFQAGVRSSLQLNTNLFGPLSHDTIKMVEFPIHSGSHATLNGNLIPTSENYLLCDVDHQNNEVFNVPFFVGAHEVAHYWWGHRVDPANVPGGRFITEGLADYLAIKVVENTYGPDFATTMRRNWRELYFRARAGRGNEVPLIEAPLADDADYLNYRKGALAFHGLARAIGEDIFHAALARFERRFRNTEPPYATASELVDSLRAATPDSLRYLIHDYFETITLYDNRIDQATVAPTATGQWEVSLDFTVSK
ncbi:MAG: M1 family aminopeptidase, partial [Bacteroidota bacterium]